MTKTTVGNAMVVVILMAMVVVVVVFLQNTTRVNVFTSQAPLEKIISPPFLNFTEKKKPQKTKSELNP